MWFPNRAVYRGLLALFPSVTALWLPGWPLFLLFARGQTTGSSHFFLASWALINFNLPRDLAEKRQHLLLNKLKLSLEMKDESTKAWSIQTSQLAKYREGNRAGIRREMPFPHRRPGQVSVDGPGEALSSPSSFPFPPPAAPLLPSPCSKMRLFSCLLPSKTIGCVLYGALHSSLQQVIGEQCFPS